MLKVTLPVFLGLLLPANPTLAQTPAVLSAYLVADTAVSFNPPTALPWDSLVPLGLRRSALERNPTRLQVLSAERSEYGSTEITFPLPVPPDLARRHYYLLDSTGIHPITPTQLLGTARLQWADPTSRLASVHAFGALQAPAPPGGHGGFVLVADQPLDLRTEASTLTADALLAPQGDTYPGQGTPFRQIVRQYLIRVANSASSQWVWVQWAPDTAVMEGGCTYRYALFRWQPMPEPVATTDYGCDV